ncbi:hypothetical protein CgunFtcFv8_010507 [Champsocephalus gunnari]|uniref:Endonuclease/exonuclease/phosphatase domain-containing protein n=1 Tax=Champsocephalus gunnari TaxID=52237 RepID=A0AAN8DU29_CHAGU|nr:hypothetical protein CgunFtcFv8_010507 [Champsocephalus gunnari]
MVQKTSRKKQQEVRIPGPEEARGSFLSQAQKEDSSASVWWPGPARKGNVGNTSASPSRGPTTYGKQRWGRVRCQKGGSESGGSRRTRPGRQKLALGTWNVTSLGGKEPELVWEVERYQLDLVGLTSTHSVGSGTLLLDRGWPLFFSRVAQGVRRRVGVGILTSPRLGASLLEFTPVDERVASLRLRVMGGGKL